MTHSFWLNFLIILGIFTGGVGVIVGFAVLLAFAPTWVYGIAIGGILIAYIAYLAKVVTK